MASDDRKRQPGGMEGEPAVPTIDEVTALVDPTKSTRAKPGSDEKVTMLAARYAAGLALWDDGDNEDHGPSDADSAVGVGQPPEWPA